MISYHIFKKIEKVKSLASVIKKKLRFKIIRFSRRENVSTFKPLEEIIRENVFYLGGNRDHIPACLCYMLYCVTNSKKFNLAYFMAKRMKWVTMQARLILPYGMLLTRLFDFFIDENLELQNEFYVLYDRVMNPLTAQLEREPRRDRGTTRGHHSTSSSTLINHLHLISKMMMMMMEIMKGPRVQVLDRGLSTLFKLAD
nr:pentatricopeptide repeat-containing protein [Tanacetum cinerariifolium]